MTVLFSDDFNRADSGSLGGLWSGGSIASNRAQVLGFTANYATNSTALGTGNYSVETSLYQDGLASGSSVGIGIVARFTSTAEFYLLWVDAGALNYIIFRVTGGAFSAIGGFAFGSPNASPVKLKFKLNGSALSAEVNDVEVATATDSTHTSGAFGMRTFNGSDAAIDAHGFDYIIVEDFGAAAQDTPELRGRPHGLRGDRQMRQLLAQ